MMVHDCRQNSPEWHILRAGIPTASMMDKIITKGGEKSKQAERYKYRLLAERIMGRPIDGHFSWSMERGSELERKALQYYQFQTDYQTQPCGFVTPDHGKWGGSPDQLVGENGLLEIKCPEVETHIMYLMAEGSAYEEYKVQAQSLIWICEREWVDFLSYHPDLPWSLHRINRDEPFIVKLATAVDKFSDELELLSLKAKELGWFRRDSIREPQGSMQDNLMKALKDSLVEVKGP